MKSKLLIHMILCAVTLSSLPQMAIAKNDKPKNEKPNKGYSGNDGRPGKSGGVPGRNKNAPFDLGIGLLVGAGAAYGIKKALDNKRRNTTRI
jgi:hypothetical protein